MGAQGQQSDGSTYEVKVDGHCDRVAFVSDASNLALTSTNRAAWRSSVTAAPPAGAKQVYVRVLGKQGDNTGLRGLTFLASASSGQRRQRSDRIRALGRRLRTAGALR